VPVPTKLVSPNRLTGLELAAVQGGREDRAAARGVVEWGTPQRKAVKIIRREEGMEKGRGGWCVERGGGAGKHLRFLSIRCSFSSRWRFASPMGSAALRFSAATSM